MGDFDEYRIFNEDLREADVPRPQAAWQIVETFALSFDGYEHHGSFARCADIANRWEAAYKKNRSRPRSLDDLRTCLFFEQRRWRHFDAFPDTEAMRYIRSLLTEIRRLVRSSQLAPRQSGSQRNQKSPRPGRRGKGEGDSGGGGIGVSP